MVFLETNQMGAEVNSDSGSSREGNSCKDKLLPATTKASRVVQISENTVIYSEGETPDALYMLRTGSVKILVKRSLKRGRIASPDFITRVVGPMEFFGYQDMMLSRAYRETAQAIRSSEVEVFSKESIQSILNGPASLFKSLLSQAIQDLQNQEVVEQLHYLASVQERIAYQLLVLADRFGNQTEQGIEINLKLSRNELAQLAGTINESLSRHLTDLKNQGIIELRGKDILIKDRSALIVKSGSFKHT